MLNKYFITNSSKQVELNSNEILTLISKLSVNSVIVFNVSEVVNFSVISLFSLSRDLESYELNSFSSPEHALESVDVRLSILEFAVFLALKNVELRFSARFSDFLFLEFSGCGINEFELFILLRVLFY